MERALRSQLRSDAADFRLHEVDYGVSFNVHHGGETNFLVIQYFRGFGAIKYQGYFDINYKLVGVTNMMAVEGRPGPK